MKLILTFVLVCLFSVLSFGQSLNYRYLAGNRLEIYAWFTGIQPEQIKTSGKITIISLSAPTAPIVHGFDSCSFNDCKLTLSNGFDQSKEYILIIDYQDQNNKPQRTWGNLKTTAEITSSKDVNEARNEVLVKSKIPLNVPDAASLNLQRTQLKIDSKSYYVIAETKKVEVKEVVPNNPGGTNNTELVLKLKKKIEEGSTTSFSLPLTTLNSVAGGTINAEGAVEIGGIASPPDTPSAQISLANIAGVKQKPVFDLSGFAGFRTQKFATLAGRYIGTEEKGCDNFTPQQGELRDKCREDIEPIDYFAGFRPSVNFDIGFNSTKSKNAIIVNAPLVYYFNLTNRSIIDAKIKKEVEAYNAEVDAYNNANPDKSKKAKGVPLYVYGGWANTPFFRLADIKLSFGPKVEFFNRYQPRNFLGSVRADFEFHRWLGTIASRRKLLSYDLNATASRDTDKRLFGRLRGVDFGWKFVPYLAFDGGAKVADETVEKTISSIKQSVLIPKYGIARISGGGVGTFEWLVKRRYFAFNTDYSFSYLAATETNSVATNKFLLLRNIKGLQTFFKTSFEFSLDPARRYSLKTTWENGRALPSLEYLNKITTGINITY